MAGFEKPEAGDRITTEERDHGGTAGGESRTDAVGAGTDLGSGNRGLGGGGTGGAADLGGARNLYESGTAEIDGEVTGGGAPDTGTTGAIVGSDIGGDYSSDRGPSGVDDSPGTAGGGGTYMGPGTTGFGAGEGTTGTGTDTAGLGSSSDVGGGTTGPGGGGSATTG